jgi:hypothetical protein
LTFCKFSTFSGPPSASKGKDDYFLEKVLDWKHYQQALNKYGKLEIDECFGYLVQVKVCNQNIHLFQAFRIYLMPADNASNPILSLKNNHLSYF